MPIDPTGYAGALEAIQPGQLSERQQRIATALAMIRDGASILSASKKAQIPVSTMWRYHHNISKLGNSEGDGMDADVMAISQVSADVALIAAEAVRDELVNNREAWKPADLVRAYSAATDRVIAFQGRSKGPEQGVSALAQLLTGRKVTIEDSRPGDDAIEVDVREIG